MAGRGRGRASTLPAWMTKQGDGPPAPPPARSGQFEDAAEPPRGPWGGADRRASSPPPRHGDLDRDRAPMARPRSLSRDRGFPGGNGYGREPQWGDRGRGGGGPDFRRSRSRDRGGPPPWEQNNGGYGGGYGADYGRGGPPQRRSRSRSRERRPPHSDHMNNGGRGREDYYNDGRDYRGGWDRGGGGGYDRRDSRYARDGGDRGYGGGGGGRREDRDGGYREDPYQPSNGGGGYQSGPADTDASARRSSFLSGRRFNDFVREAAKTAAVEYRSGATEDGEVSGDDHVEGEPREQK